MKTELNVVKNEVVVNINLEGLTYKEVTPDMFNNKKLGKMVENFSKCEGRISEEQWKAARYMGEMASVDMIKSDFGSDQAFADFMDMSRSDVNKLKRVSKLEDVAKNHGLTVSKAYELLPLQNVDDLSVAQFLLDNNVNEKTTQKELRELVKTARNAIEAKEESEPETEDIDTDTEEEVETSDISGKDTLVSNGTKYTLPYTNDDGDICETEFTLTEKQLSELAKAVDKILFNIR